MPLFNLSHSLSRGIRSVQFDRLLKQGTTGRKGLMLPGAKEPRIKYFVVLNKDPHEAELLTIISQSNPVYALQHDLLKTHLIKVTPAESDHIFRKECYLDCTKIITIPRSGVLAEFIADATILVGNLPPALIRRIMRVVIGSMLISAEHQERIHNDNYFR